MKKIQEKILYLTATPNQQIHKIGFILWAENSSLENITSQQTGHLYSI
jgi:hypothetical protein